MGVGQRLKCPGVGASAPDVICAPRHLLRPSPCHLAPVRGHTAAAELPFGGTACCLESPMACGSSLTAPAMWGSPGPVSSSRLKCQLLPEPPVLPLQDSSSILGGASIYRYRLHELSRVRILYLSTTCCEHQLIPGHGVEPGQSVGRARRIKMQRRSDARSWQSPVLPGNRKRACLCPP